MVQAVVLYALTGCSYRNVQKYSVFISECKKILIFRHIIGTGCTVVLEIYAVGVC